jgi:hypothetical protein
MVPVTCAGALFAALAVLLAAPAGAANRYVRPYNYNGGTSTGDGSTWASAWNGLGRINWSQVGPGDTLFVCGPHSQWQDGVNDHNLAIVRSGTAQSRLVISGECMGANGPDPGSINNARLKLQPGAWTPDLFGTWRQAVTGSTNNMLLEQEVGTAALTTAAPGRLFPWVGGNYWVPCTPQPCNQANFNASLALADRLNWPPGVFVQHDNYVYLKPALAGPPTQTFYTAGGNAVQIVNQSWVTIRKLTVFGHGTARIYLENADYIVIEDNDIRRGVVNISVWNDSDNGIIRRNRIHDTFGGSGIFFATGAYAKWPDPNTQSHDGWLIARNEIFDIAQDCQFCEFAQLAYQDMPGRFPNNLPDRHGVGIQGGGSNNVIEYNHLYNIGGEAIGLYNWSNRPGGNPQRNNLIRYNYVRDIVDLSPLCLGAYLPVVRCGTGRGIELGSDSNLPIPTTITGNYVHHNVIARTAGAALRTKSSKPAAGYTWHYLNNTVIDAQIGFQFAVATSPQPHLGGAEFRNNLVRSSSSSPGNYALAAELSAGATAAHTSGFGMSNNLYFPAGSGRFA